jgi:hypothetical protein
MGLNPTYLDFIQKCVDSTLGELSGKRMLELGDQVIRGSLGPERTGKEYFENRGVLHTSFDMNGEHGALKVDLSKPITNPEWLNAFDIVTNAGTSEHVEPHSTQYICFMNIHNCLKAGGIAVHLIPDIFELENSGHWKNHCNNYYSHEFFVLLAKLNGYSLFTSTTIGGLRCVGLQKNTDAPFTSDRDAVLAAIVRKEGGIVYHGIEGNALTRPFGRMVQRLIDTTRPLRQHLGLKRSTLEGLLTSKSRSK